MYRLYHLQRTEDYYVGAYWKGGYDKYSIKCSTKDNTAKECFGTNDINIAFKYKEVWDSSESHKDQVKVMED